MSCHSSDVPESQSDQAKAPSHPVAKRLPLALFSHMLLLGLAQAVTHIVAPAAKPPPVPVIRIAGGKDNGTRKRRSSSEDPLYQKLQASHSQNIDPPENLS